MCLCMCVCVLTIIYMQENHLKLFFFIFDSGTQVSELNMINTAVSVPGLVRFPREGNGNSLQYSCLENPMDRGAWWATIHGLEKSQTQQKRLSMIAHQFIIWEKFPYTIAIFEIKICICTGQFTFTFEQDNLTLWYSPGHKSLFCLIFLVCRK